jgi:hypothetical protein
MTTDQITTQYWQLSTASQGEVVTDMDDINQCILTIISTQKGTDPLRTDFGVDLQSYIDKPMETVTAGLIADIIYQVNTYEKRCIIDTITFTGEIGHLTISINWTTLNGQPYTTNYVNSSN